ncbi:MAG: hypothetical protein J5790_08835 [Bacteroidaceae bacterium]|nr:hypothetical protein [Bacteroidaceae bacterium]
MNKYFLLSALISVASATYAQDSYDAQNFANSDLNGTSRFVAMGGALGALGGDVSVMSTNPAGTGMYRSSDAALSFSGLFTGDGAMGHDGARMSFDQGGVLIAFDMDNPTSMGLQFVNFGVNYQKKRNFLFNQLTDINNLGGMLSQTYQIANLCNEAFKKKPNGTDWGTIADMSAAKNGVHGGILDESGTSGSGYAGLPGDKAYFEKATFGSNSQADVNISFNISDQFFLGASVGVYSLDYSRESFYQESGIDGNIYDFTNWYKTEGDGFDVKLGFICRPIEESPFRFGFTVHTPTWYRLTDANGSDLFFNNDYLSSGNNAEYDYRFRTPWKFGVSLGHTIGTNFAIGAEYEYQDMSSAHYSEVDGYNSNYFRYINDVTKHTLRGQHTLKVGAEFKPIDELSLRVGYNFVSSPFKKDACRTLLYCDPYTETDYTNWGNINRFSLGLGYRYRGGYVDLAWQYQAQKGDFYAFYDENLKPTKINANRSQLMATFGFRF